MKNRRIRASFGPVAALYAIECLEDRLLMTGNSNIPRAIGSSVAVEPEKQVSGSAFAIDVDGGPLTYTLTTGPRPGTGTLLFNKDGSFTFTADGVDVDGKKFVGQTDFTFSADDGEFYSDLATVTITVQSAVPPVDVPIVVVTNVNVGIPTADNGSLIVSAGGVASGQLTARDPEGQPLTFSIVTQPSNGTVNLGSLGAFTYTVKAGSTATSDVFTFTVSDGKFFSDLATVSITVQSAVPPVVVPPVDVTNVNVGIPTADNGSFIVSAGGVASGQLTARDPEGQLLTFMLVNAPPPGTGSVFVNPDGSFAYMANVPGFNGPTTFTFVASDGKLTSFPATVTIMVGSVGTPNVGIPTADNSSLIVSAGQSVSGKVTASDPEGGPLTFTLTTAPPPGTGTVLFNPDGTYTFTANVPGFSGPTTFTFTAMDGGGLTSFPATVTVTVGSVVPPTVNVPMIALSGVNGVVYVKPSKSRPGLPLAATAKLTGTPVDADYRLATITAEYTAGAAKGDTFKIWAIPGLKVSSSSIKDGRVTIAKIKLTTVKVTDPNTSKRVNIKRMTVTFKAGTEALVNSVLQAISASNTRYYNSTRTVKLTVNAKKADQTFFSASGTLNANSQ